MILQTGQEINELDQSGFYTTGATIFTGNLGRSKYIVQVGLHPVRGAPCSLTSRYSDQRSQADIFKKKLIA